MSQKENKNGKILFKENFGFGVFIVILGIFILVPFVMSIVFDSRHSENFAKTQLANFGFKQIEILKKYSIATPVSLFSITTENWFDFRAMREYESVEGTLICSRQIRDWKESHCNLNLIQP